MEGVQFSHTGGRARLVDINLCVPAGEVVCLLGPNGAGKTTLLRCMLGLIAPEAGRVLLGGDPLSAMSVRERARRVAYVPQATDTAFPFTALDMAVMGRTPHLGRLRTPNERDRRRARQVLVDLGIERVADQSFSSLSGGERALTLVARAIVQEARVLVLDEPTAALDLGNTVQVLDVVAGFTATGRTVVMTTHQPDHALRVAHRAVLIDEGRIVADGPPRTVLTSERLTDVYRTPVEVAQVRLADEEDALPVCIPL